MNLTNYNIEALCKTYGYSNKINDGDGKMINNPESEEDFAMRQVLNFVEEVTKAYHINKSVEITRTTAKNEADVLEKPTIV